MNAAPSRGGWSSLATFEKQQYYRYNAIQDLLVVNLLATGGGIRSPEDDPIPVPHVL